MQALVADFRMGRISRRQFLQTMAMFSGGVALAACAPGAPAAQAPAGAAAPAGGIEPKLMIYGGSQDIASSALKAVGPSPWKRAWPRIGA
jgi:hypothetical protein